MSSRKNGRKAPSSAGAVIRRRQPAKAPKRTPKRKPDVLEGKLKPNQTPQEANASLLVAGLAPNAAVAREWSGYPFGQVEKTVDLTFTLNDIVDAAERVNAGDLGDVEALLTAQTVTLNAVFATLAYKANVTRQMDHFERF